MHAREMTKFRCGLGEVLRSNWIEHRHRENNILEIVECEGESKYEVAQLLRPTIVSNKSFGIKSLEFRKEGDIAVILG